MIYYSPLMEVLKYVCVIYNVYKTIQFPISKENPCILEEQNSGVNQSTLWYSFFMIHTGVFVIPTQNTLACL